MLSLVNSINIWWKSKPFLYNCLGEEGTVPNLFYELTGHWYHTWQRHYKKKTCRPVSLKGKDVKRKNPYQNINKSNPLFIIYLYMPNCNQVRLTPSMQGWYIFHKLVKLITLREYRLTLEHRFELLGSTYTQIFFNSKCYCTAQSVVGWILQYAEQQIRGTLYTDGLTINYLFMDFQPHRKLGLGLASLNPCVVEGSVVNGKVRLSQQGLKII